MKIFAKRRGEKKTVQNMKNNTHLSFTESVRRLSVIRTDQIFGCPFQPEDEFEPDYYIHGLVLKSERERKKKKKSQLFVSLFKGLFCTVDP